MADGDVVQKIGSPEVRRHWLMIDDKVAVADGVWVDLSKFTKELELRFTGITTATLQVRGSSASTKPLDTDDQVQEGLDVIANGTVNIQHPPRWLKVKISAWTSGTIRVFMTGSA